MSRDLRNKDIQRQAIADARLRSLSEKEREKLIEQMAMVSGAALGLEFRMNEEELEKGFKLHPVERQNRHRALAKRLGL